MLRADTCICGHSAKEHNSNKLFCYADGCKCKLFKKMVKEKVILAEIYKQDGDIGISMPNSKDTPSFELYGFLKVYLEIIEQELFESFE